MKQKISVILVLAMIMGAVSGCKLKETVLEKITPQSSTVSEEKVVRYPTEISLALENMKGANPYEEESEGNLQALRIAYEPLFAYADEMRVVPVLAESFSVSEDGKQITVRIKENIKCHNGETLTGKDILNTLNMVLASKFVRFSNEIQRVALQDNRTVVVSFLNSQSNAAEKLMFPIVKSSGNSISGTGPYMYSGKESSDTYVFSAFSEYHGISPEIKTIRLINAPDSAAVERLFNVGQTDVLTSEAFDYSTFSVDAQMRVYDYPTNELVYLGLNFDNSIFWGESTRQALKFLIDKDEIVEKVMYKKAQKADFPINPSSWLYPSDLGYTKDSGKAEELLLKDSWTRVDGVFARMIDGKRQDLELDMLVLDEPQLSATARMIEKYLDNFGIKCNVNIKSEAEFLQQMTDKNYDLLLNSTMLRGSADLETLTGEGNIFGYLNSELNVLSASIRTQSDETALKDSYRKCCDILEKDVQFIPLYFKKDALITGVSVSENVKCSPDNPFYNISEWNR